MNFDLPTFLARFKELSDQAFAVFAQPSVYYQLVIVAALFLLSLFAAKKVEPRLAAWAEGIQANPGLTRVIKGFLHNMEWVILAALLALSQPIIAGLNWSEAGDIVYTTLLLVLAWLVISAVSRSIRNLAVARLISLLAWAYLAISIIGITAQTTELLDAIGFSVGEVRISALLLIKSVVLIGLTLWAAVSIGEFLDRRIQNYEDLTPSIRVLIGKVLKITLIVVGGFIAISGIGIDLTLFTVFSGAIGVGIGFGLQKVVSNFISGVIILLDRSIKPGDTISLGETFGWIRELRARFVSVVTRDGREYLIPNEDFITREVINWSYSDDLVRVDVPFGVSYNSNPHEVMEISVAASEGIERVVAYPPPVCWLTGFGDSSLDFVLRFWIRDPQRGLTNSRGLVLLALWDAFKEHGIAIPYPHREVIMKTPVTVVEPADKPREQ